MPRFASAAVGTPTALPDSTSSASRCFAVKRHDRRVRCSVSTAFNASRPAAVIAATRLVLWASAREPRVFGGRTAVIASPGPGGVVLRRPRGQRDDVCRHERLRVENLREWA